MNKTLNKFFLLIISTLFISSCSTLNSLKFWDDEEEEVELPTELVSFNTEVDIQVVWKTNSGSGIEFGINEPFISGEHIFLAKNEGIVSSLSTRNGKEEWKKKTNDYISGSVGYGYKTILYGTLDGEIVALSDKNGDELWRVQLSSEILAPPASDGSIVAVQTSDGKLTALNLKSGDVDWTYTSQVPNLSLRGTSTPIVTNGVVFGSFANGKSVMISADSGSARWELPITINEGKSELDRIVDIDGKAILDGKIFVASTYQGNIMAIDISTGKPLWQEKFSSTKNLTSSRSRIVGVNVKDIVQGFGLSTGVTVWRQDGLKLRELSSPVNIKGMIAVGDFEGYIHLLDSRDGTFIGRSKVSSKPINQISIFSNNLIVTDKSGSLFMLSII